MPAMHSPRTLCPIVMSSALVVGSLTSGSAVAAKPPKVQDTASSITYTLPETQVRAGIDLVVTNCSPVEVKGAVALLASAIPSPNHRFTIRGADRAWFRLKRDLTLDLHPNGALKSVNGAVSDRSAAIIFNVVKMLATGVSIGLMYDSTPRCNDEVSKKLNDAKKLGHRITELQTEIIDKKPDSPDGLADLQEQIDVLANRLAAIEQESLTVRLSKTIDFESGMAKEGGYEGVLRWDHSQLGSHFDVPDDGKNLTFDLAWKLTDPRCGAETKCISWPADSVAACGNCSDTLVFREPVPATLEVSMPLHPVVAGANLQFPMAQWGTLTYFPLRAKFGEKRSLRLAMDEFGRRLSYTWSSAARGEEITSAASGIVDGVAAYRNARESEDTMARKAEIEEFETLMEWNAMKRCQAAMEAGASKCPEDPD